MSGISELYFAEHLCSLGHSPRCYEAQGGPDLEVVLGPLGQRAEERFLRSVAIVLGGMQQVLGGGAAPLKRQKSGRTI